MKRKQEHGPTKATRPNPSALALRQTVAGVSGSALSQLLHHIRDHGLPEASSRRTQYRERKQICQQSNAFGKLVEQVELPRVGGGKLYLAVQNPLALLHEDLRDSHLLREAFRAALETHPSSRANAWSIVIYCDGVNPADGLAKNHSRKCCTWYWSILEFGQEWLHHEEIWYELTTARCEGFIDKLEGGYARVTAEALAWFFRDGCDVERNGIDLELDGMAFKLYLKVGVIFGDVPAFSDMCSAKGHAGTKACALCMNFMIPRGEAAEEVLRTSGYFQGLACTDFGKFKPHTAETHRCVFRALADCKRSQSAAALRDKAEALGFNYNPHCLALHPRLHEVPIADTLMFDPGHMYVMNGLADVEFGMCMSKLRATFTTYVEIAEYARPFVWPQRAPMGEKSVQRLVSENTKKNLKAESFSSTGSEFLCLAPVLFLYFSRVAQVRHAADAFAPLVDSFLAVLLVIELLQLVKRNMLTPGDLRDAIKAHLDLFIVAYGADGLRPKHHYVLHLPSMLAKFGTLLSAYTHERKHRFVKQTARPRYNLKGWEAGVVEDLTVKHRHVMANSRVKSFLANPRAPSKGERSLLQDVFPNIAAATHLFVSREITTSNGSVTVDDAVLFYHGGGFAAGQLMLGVEINGESFVVVKKWDLVDAVANAFPRYRVTANGCVLAGSALASALIHRPSADGSESSVVLPREFVDGPLV